MVGSIVSRHCKLDLAQRMAVRRKFRIARKLGEKVTAIMRRLADEYGVSKSAIQRTVYG